MKTIVTMLLFLSFPLVDKNATSTEVLQSMYSRYHTQWHKSLTFNQTTERYRNDSLIKTSTWYETIVYPDLLRIDFDSVKSSAGVIFRHDSTYVFRNKKIVRSSNQSNPTGLFGFVKTINSFACSAFSMGIYKVKPFGPCNSKTTEFLNSKVQCS